MKFIGDDDSPSGVAALELMRAVVALGDGDHAAGAMALMARIDALEADGPLNSVMRILSQTESAAKIARLAIGERHRLRPAPAGA